MVNAGSDSGPLFDEVAIADFNQFQIAVLTTTQMVNRRILSAQVPVPERLYQRQGWLVCNQQIVANIDALKVGFVFPKKSPFRSIRRLSPGVPVSFEVKSSQPLPPQVHDRAAFVCEFPEAAFPHHSVFRAIAPRFVRLYPFETGTSLLDKVEHMLAARDLFISQNYQQLKQIPFYQKNFDL